MIDQYSRSVVAGVRELVGAEVLVIDKDPSVHNGMSQLLASANLHVTCVDNIESAKEHMSRRFFSVVIADLDTPRPGAGVKTIDIVGELSPTSMIVMLTARKSFEDSVQCIRAGAVDVIWKAPESVKYLKERVVDAAGRAAGQREVNSILVDVSETYDEFLKAFMSAERRAVDLEDRLKGRDPDELVDSEIRVLVIDGDRSLAEELAAAAPPGFLFDAALTGGEGLDRCGSSRYQMVMVSESLADLPCSMVVRSAKTQWPGMIALQHAQRGAGGKVEIIETTRKITVLDDFQNAKQLADRLDELAQAFRAKARERRYTQSFRERHYDFLRRFVELKSKIDRALSGP